MNICNRLWEIKFIRDEYIYCLVMLFDGPKRFDTLKNEVLSHKCVTPWVFTLLKVKSYNLINLVGILVIS